MATYARNCGIVSNQFAANLPRNLLVKRIENRLKIDRIMATSLWSHILAHSSCNVTVVGIYHSRCNDQQFRCSQALNLRTDTAKYSATFIAYRLQYVAGNSVDF